jgi:type I restriction enzyme M protein
MAKSNDTNIGFEEQIWEAACVLWGHIPAAEYRKVIVGLIFLRYISNAFEKRYKELLAEGDGFEDDRDAYTMENIFFVPKNARWDVISGAAHTAEIGTVLDNAMREIESENKSLKNVLPKNYATPDLDKRVLGDVVDVFSNIDMNDTSENKDLLGRTYEYCIAKFAAKEGAKGGEFYTPTSIVKTIVEILKPYENCRVYDPCCGSGGMFVQSVKFLQAHSGNRGNISVFGQESNADTWKMAKMNMAIRGIEANFGTHHADTFYNDLHPTLKADFIMANPPFNKSNWGQDKLLEDIRWKYGVPSKNNANFAWIQHMIHHLSPNGKIGLVLANGALSSQTSGEGEIRKKIIEDDLIEGIVALPPQLFYSVTIPVTLWFISKNKTKKGKTLFIDARNMGFMADRTHKDFKDEDIAKLADTFTAFQKGTLEDVKGFCSVADLEQIKKHDYVLTPGRYVGIEDEEDDGEPFEEKMTRLTSELSDMFKKSHDLEEDINNKLEAIGYEIY